jgi:hypothetical protein
MEYPKWEDMSYPIVTQHTHACVYCGKRQICEYPPKPCLRVGPRVCRDCIGLDKDHPKMKLYHVRKPPQKVEFISGETLAQVAERCRNDKHHGCFCGCHIAEIDGNDWTPKER